MDAKKYGYMGGVPWREVEKLLQEIDAERAAAETPASLERPLAFNVLDEIRARHERVSHLLDSSQRDHLGSMALNDAHADRNYLLGLIPPNWTHRPAVKAEATRSGPGPLPVQHPAPCWCPYCGEPHSPEVSESDPRLSEKTGKDRG